MSQAVAHLSLLLLTLLATSDLGRTWVEEDIDEQFYSLSATDATGQSIPMSSYVGKVMWKCAVCRPFITINYAISTSYLNIIMQLCLVLNHYVCKFVTCLKLTCLHLQAYFQMARF